MGFKLGSERRDFKSSKNVDLSSGKDKSYTYENVKVFETPLDKGTIAEARNDGTIAINSEAKATISQKAGSDRNNNSIYSVVFGSGLIKETIGTISLHICSTRLPGLRVKPLD